jgi:hypothetical protein
MCACGILESIKEGVTMNDNGGSLRNSAGFILRQVVPIVLLVGVWCSSAAPQESSEIAWNKMFRLSDARLFVTDGAITLDAELAKPRELPDTELPASTGQVMERYMAAELPDEFALRDLERGTRPETYEAPSGVTLAGKYVEFLRRVVPRASLRMKGDLEPVVILSDGKAVGLVMAVRRPGP